MQPKMHMGVDAKDDAEMMQGLSGTDTVQGGLENSDLRLAVRGSAFHCGVTFHANSQR
jgi:hypothetical protein